ncbi:MAG: exopolysaccharide biosynthesis polyprenyl glycosylphosphotransferase [Paludibacteraceae bacterium]|nr:exopolysaccharide biosynthesis polyprenyl glycosylphosphotransferase [Paludibacteraceae bacterium]
MSAYRKQQLKYIIADIFSAVVVWIAFLLFRWLVYEGKVFGVNSVLIPAFNFFEPLFLYPLGCFCIYYLSGYYLRPFHKSISKEIITTFIDSSIVAFGAFFIIIIDDQVEMYERYIWSLVVLFALQFIICYIPRLYITLRSRKQHKEEPSVTIEQTQDMDENALYEEIARVFPSGKQIYVVPRMYDILTGAAHINELNRSPYICITEQRMSDAGICIKRASDIVLSVLSLVILSPLLLILAIMVKCSSPGPVLYIQERVGMYGRTFNILKFRTMTEGTEGPVPQLSNDNDPRITPIGRRMRKYRLDELPQLINIIRGEMSIVGPRPERQYFINQIIEKAPYYCLLYKIRPGLTSWGPIKVGYTDTIDKMIERLKYDIAYMENMSLKLDIKILFYTIGVILDGKGK